MINRIIPFVFIVYYLIFFGKNYLNAQITLDAESGMVFTGYNDVRIPGNSGSLFSLNDELIAQNKIFYRIRAGYILKSHHNFSLLFAPLSINSSGSLPTDISFAGKVFPANTDIKAKYKFNSYRFTYRYDFIQKPKIEFGLGLTAKIRDAQIAFESTGISAEKSNIGLVPIINFRILWKLNDKSGLLIDGDALVAKQGRAEDIIFAALYRLNDQLAIRMGYRILEGGSDGTEVYGFALFNYASVGVSYTF